LAGTVAAAVARARATGGERPVRSRWAVARPALSGTGPDGPRVLRGNQSEFGLARDQGGLDASLRAAGTIGLRPAGARIAAGTSVPAPAPQRIAPARGPPTTV
jgi:hypothetical protein